MKILNNSELFKFSKTLSKDVTAFIWKALFMVAVWIFLDQWLSLDLGIMYSLQFQGIQLLNKITGLNYQATQMYVTATTPKFGLICDTSYLIVGKTCNGKSLLFMYLSFVLIYPNIPRFRRFLFLILGLLLLHELNVLRIVGLTLILQYKPHFFPSMHHYFFQVFMYVVIFLLVRIFLRFENYKNEVENFK